MLTMDIPAVQLKRRIEKQLYFLTDFDETPELDANLFDEAVRRQEESLSKSIAPQVIRGGGIHFSSMHIGQYASFLYWLARSASKENKLLAERISYLNTCVNSIWLNHNVDMPEHFYLDHPLGTIIGKANIGDYFGCLQNCTVGAVEKNGQLIFPKLGIHVEMLSESSVIGDCTVGNNVILSANCVVKNQDIPDNCIVFGQDRDICIKQLGEKMRKYFSFFDMVSC